MSKVTKVEIKAPSKKEKNDDNVIKVDLSKPPIKKEEKEEEKGVETSEVIAEEKEVITAKETEEVEEDTKTPETEEVPSDPFTGMKEVPKSEVKEVKQSTPEPLEDEPEASAPSLPEDIEKLLAFMKDTNGNMEDYVRLNADYSNVDPKTLLKEYYKKSKPHLDAEEISFLMEDKFSYDEDLDDERDIRMKKLAQKEEVAKAHKFLDGVKDKYYAEIKSRPSANKDQQKATDFFNRFSEEQEVAKKQHQAFKNSTSELFTDKFEGFDFNVGEKQFRYGIKDPVAVAEKQSDISNFIGKFLDKEGYVKDVGGYHKAMYAANNSDTIAQHFYEQGKADAIKDIAASSRNISDEARSSGDNGAFINGLRVKSISSVDSSKLRIKSRK
jgi:hypothetical protein